MRRAFSPDVPELMDITQGDTAALEKDLADLESLNARFGGHEIIRLFLPLWLDQKQPARPRLRVLDLATASGDIPRMIAGWARGRGIEIEIDAVDFNPATLAIARSRSATYPEINYIKADLLSFAPAPRAYDIVLCSLAVHHFSEDDAVRVLRLCREASRRFVLVSELRRGWPGRFAIWLLTATLYRRAMIKYDSRLSVRRAFTADELCGLARRAGWRHFGHKSYFPVRQALWLRDVLAKPESPGA